MLPDWTDLQLFTQTELLYAWARAWAVSRGRPAPQPVAGGVRIRLAHAARYVMRATPGWLGDPGIPVGTELKVLTSTEELRPALDRRWLPIPAVELMTTAFSRGAVTIPAGYTPRLSADGRSMVATFHTADGAVACTARLAPSGDVGIVDQVDTVPAHGRRGLATAALITLGNWAVGEGLRTGVLAATAQGEPLYRRLGWTPHGPIAGAVFKGTSR